jgi:peptidoglycan glycosyltransferase
LPASEDHAPDGGILDRARFGLDPPGSTFKLVTAIAALQSDPALADFASECVRLPDGRVGAQTRWGVIRDDVADLEPHGVLRLEQAMAVSCNAYFSRLAARVGAGRLHAAARSLGIRAANPDDPATLAVSLAQAGYGQGQVLATPFQMARAAATVASGGWIPQARWQANERGRDAPVRGLDPTAAALLGRAMRLAVTRGTGNAALASGIPIAGKTGTAEVAGAPSHAWFAGFAPYGAGSGRVMAFSILVENGGYGGTVAATLAPAVVDAARESGLL